MQPRPPRGCQLDASEVWRFGGKNIRAISDGTSGVDAI